MENKEDNIEDLFRERFENDEVPVSPMVWQNIKLTLPDDKKSFGFIFSQNMVLWSIASILLVSALIGSYIHFSQKESAATLYHPKQTVSKPALNNYNKKSDNIHPIDESSTENSNHHVPENRPENIVYKNTVNKNHASSASSMDDFSDKETIHSKKIGATTNHKSTASTEQKSNSRKNQKEGSFAHNDRGIANNKSKAETPDLAYKNKSQNSSNKKTNRNDGNQNTQSSKSLTETKNQSQNQHTIVRNNSTRDALSAQEFETKRKKELDKNKLSTATDTAVLSSTIDNTVVLTYPDLKNSYNANNESTSVLKDSLDKINPISIAGNPFSGSLNAASSIKNTETIDSATHSMETKNILAEHNIAPSDSSASTQASSIEQYVIKDSLSGILASISMNQDSSLTKLDSLQPAHQDSVLTKTTDKKEKEKNKLLSRLSFDLLATTLLTGATTSTSATDSVYPSAVEDKNRNDRNSLGYSAGLAVNYKISDRLRASAGIAYTNFSEQYHFTYTLKQSYWIFIDTAWQQVEYDSIYKDFNVKDQYSFLSIPLQLSYTFLQKGKLKLSATVGLRSNILLKGVTYLANNRKDDVRKITSGFNTISFMYQASLEAEYKWSEHTALLLQPVFLYGATSIHSKASTLQQKPYGIGLTVGLRFTF